LYFHAGFTGKVSEIIVDGDWNLPPTHMIDVVTDRLASSFSLIYILAFDAWKNVYR